MEVLKYGQELREAETRTEREREVIDQLLEDARWAFSGMIYGFNVRWTPSARMRGVEEILEIQPVASIPRGDPRMKAVTATRENGFVYILLEYHPDASQQNRLSAWRSQAYPSAAGSGLAPLHFDESRRRAMELAVKETLRSYLRARQYNRPEEIRARVGLLAFPVIGLRELSFHASVTLAVEVQALTPYSVD